MRLAAAILITLAWLAPSTLTAQALAPPVIEAFDTPNDDGASVTVTWPVNPDAPEGTKYRVLVAEAESGPFYLASEVAAGTSLLSDDPGNYGHDEANFLIQAVKVTEYTVSDETRKLTTDKTYFLRVSVLTGSAETRGAVTSAIPESNLFNTSRLNNFLIGAFLSVVILLSIASSNLWLKMRDGGGYLLNY